MTRIETKEWLERYAALHPSSSRDDIKKALELHVKDEERRKRTNARRTATIARNAARDEAAGLVEKVASQAAELERLRQALKDRDVVIAELKRAAAGASMFKVRHEISAVPGDDIPARAARQHELDIVSKKPGFAERVVAGLRSDVGKCSLSLRQANAFAEMLLLDVRFTRDKDQPRGWTEADMYSDDAKKTVKALWGLVDGFRRLLKAGKLDAAYQASMDAQNRLGIKR